MRSFRRLFASLFVFATLLGAMHEVIHHHQHDIDGQYEQSCPLYLLAQTPALPADVFSLAPLISRFEPYLATETSHPFFAAVPARNRSPPLL